METGREYVVPIKPYQKRLKIYNKTKNRRIKKKQEKFCPFILIQREIWKRLGNPIVKYI
jgi:hypothetical protein